MRNRVRKTYYFTVPGVSLYHTIRLSIQGNATQDRFKNLHNILFATFKFCDLETQKVSPH